MIKVNKITGGRFGNRILQYNSLIQLSHILETEPSCCDWEGRGFFEEIVENKPTGKEQKLLNWKIVLDEDLSNLPKNIDYHIDDPSYLLHNTFNKLTRKNPRDFLKIKQEFKEDLDDTRDNVGIHFRGTDIISANGNNGREVHSPEYYINAIEFVRSNFNDPIFYLCTDDIEFQTYTKTVEYLRHKNYEFIFGDLNNHFKDFALLTECDVLIGSSSTFVICAGFLGKEGKKIIHSMDWLKKQLEETYVPWGNYSKDYPEKYWKSYDNFWIDLYKGNGCEYYGDCKFI